MYLVMSQIILLWLWEIKLTITHLCIKDAVFYTGDVLTYPIQTDANLLVPLIIVSLSPLS